MTPTAYKAKTSEKAIDVVEPGRRPRKGHIAFDLGRDLEFNIDALRSYAFAPWEPVIYDAMVVAAAIEFSDRAVKRPSRGWARRISLRNPVHGPARWGEWHAWRRGLRRSDLQKRMDAGTGERDPGL
jgi:hypothetical protein